MSKTKVVPKPSKHLSDAYHDPDVEKSVELYLSKHPKCDSNTIGFIRKNNIKQKTYTEICDILSHAVTLNNGTIAGCGDKFRVWCEKLGRDVPSSTLVDAMNADPAEANLLVVEALQVQSTIYKSYCTYLAGRT